MPRNSIFLLPAAGAVLADPQHLRNVNYVFNLLRDEKPQTLLPPLAALTFLAYVPTHFLLMKICNLRILT